MLELQTIYLWPFEIYFVYALNGAIFKWGILTDRKPIDDIDRCTRTSHQLGVHEKLRVGTKFDYRPKCEGKSDD